MPTDPPTDPPADPPTPERVRFHGFDALRGGAMLLGILLHAAITYMQRRMDGLLWPLDDQPRQVGFDVLFWWIHAWRIPLFFVMAGFFAAMLARRRGPRGFLKHRIDRILKPVIVATVTILPAMYFLWGWGFQLEQRATFREVRRVSFKEDFIHDHVLGPAHLWFLYFLVVFSLVYWAVLKWRRSDALDPEPVLPAPVRACFASPLRPILFAIPTFLFLLAQPSFYLAYHHLLPRTLAGVGYELSQYVFQGYFFIVGIYLFRMHRDMQAIQRYAWLYLALAHLLFVVMVGTVGHALTLTDRGQPLDLQTRLVLAGSVALFCWLMIWGLTGLGLTLLAKPRAWVRWLSDSAYWVYLIHLPIVALLMIVMRNWAIGPWPKFIIIVAVTSAATLATYHWLVRYTFIGRWLNGPRAKPGQSTHSQ